MTVVIEFPPGDPDTPPHRHSGPAFGYMIEGEMLFELEGEPERVIQAGEAFWEPGGDSRSQRRRTPNMMRRAVGPPRPAPWNAVGSGVATTSLRSVVRFLRSTDRCPSGTEPHQSLRQRCHERQRGLDAIRPPAVSSRSRVCGRLLRRCSAGRAQVA
jgi:Cupin domain